MATIPEIRRMAKEAARALLIINADTGDGDLFVGVDDLRDCDRAVFAQEIRRIADRISTPVPEERCPHGFPTDGWDCCRHDPSLDESQEDR